MNRAFKLILFPILSVLALMFLYNIGHIAAEALGRDYRGGVGWGISLIYMTVIFSVASFIQAWLLIYSNLGEAKVYISISLVFLWICLLTFMTSTYPYRFAYYQLCALIILVGPLIGRNLTRRSNRPPTIVTFLCLRQKSRQ